MKNKIIKFLNDYNVDYVESGKNVVEGNISICCPMCTDDPSHHMGIKLSTGWWSCWRDKSHRGNNFINLVSFIAGCSYSEAKEIFGEQKYIITNEFKDLFKINKNLIVKKEKLVFDKEFKNIKNYGSTKRFHDYLLSRGIHDYKKYNLKCCLIGDWSHRIIFPIYYENKLVAWNSRSIYEREKLYYKALTQERSMRKITNCLYNYDGLIKNKGKGLYLVEGIFDYMKLDQSLPDEYEVTCLFTKTITDSQKSLLFNLSKKYSIIVLLDRDAEAESFQLVSELSFISNIKMQTLPKNYNDPAELPSKIINKLPYNIS